MENYEIDPRWRGDAGSRETSRSRGASPHSMGFSIAAHLILAAALLIVLLHLGASRPSHPDYLIAQIVDRVPGSAGANGRDGASAAAGKHTPAPAAPARDSPPKAKPAPHRMRNIRAWIGTRLATAKAEVRHHADDAASDEPRIAEAGTPAPVTKPAAPIDAISSLPGDGAGITGNRGAGSTLMNGEGGGAGSDHEAHAAYGAAPAPEYPEAARQMEQQGVVKLRVLVSADGVPKQVKVAHSSGFQLLDEAALETVRERWRFMPAVRAGTAVESWVIVPIRFALTEAASN